MTDSSRDRTQSGAPDIALRNVRSSGRSAGQYLRKIFLRPELTAIAGTAIVFVYFATTAGNTGFLTVQGTINYLEVSAQIGIIAIPVALLLIAGEFDLSIGAVVGAAQLLMVYLIVNEHWSLVTGFAAGIGLAVVVGCVNGFLVVRTRIPSFLVTLATGYIITGLATVWGDKVIGTTQLFGLNAAQRNDPLVSVFAGTFLSVPAMIWWWIALTLIGAYVLVRTRFGNWAYACGGAVDAAKKTGVPVARVKILLYVCTAAGCCLVALLSAFPVDGASVSTGSNFLFEAPVAAVIGGVLLTGGYGSIIGASVGALLFGMLSQGFFFTNIDDNWFTVFLGGMMLLSIFVNDFVRHRGARSASR